MSKVEINGIQVELFDGSEIHYFECSFCRLNGRSKRVSCCSKCQLKFCIQNKIKSNSQRSKLNARRKEIRLEHLEEARRYQRDYYKAKRDELKMLKDFFRNRI